MKNEIARLSSCHEPRLQLHPIAVRSIFFLSFFLFQERGVIGSLNQICMETNYRRSSHATNLYDPCMLQRLLYIYIY